MTPQWGASAEDLQKKNYKSSLTSKKKKQGSGTQGNQSYAVKGWMKVKGTFQLTKP